VTILTITLATILIICIARFGWTGLARLASLRWRGGALAVVACVAQFISIQGHQYRLPLLIITITALVGFCWLNRRQPGMLLIVTGMALNATVMFANGGMMPVAPHRLEQMSGMQVESGAVLLGSKDVVLEDHEAALPWLGDRIMLPGPLGQLAIWSIGDFILIAGVGRLLWVAMGKHYYERVLSHQPERGSATLH
jgi:hypothetical protein